MLPNEAGLTVLTTEIQHQQRRRSETCHVVSGLVEVVLAVVVHPDQSDADRVLAQRVDAGPLVRTAAAEYVTDVRARNDLQHPATHPHLHSTTLLPSPPPPPFYGHYTVL